MSGQRWSEGAILEVSLSDGQRCTCQMLAEPEMAFFSPDDPEKLLFRLWVERSAYSTGRWKKCGSADIAPNLASEVPRFKQDPINGALSIYVSGQERDATREECIGLERAAVWSAEQVEDRIGDHLAGRPNKWADSLRLE